MKVLFATKNPAKVKRYVSKLQKQGIEVLTLNDMDIKLEVEETGKNAIENAELKAKAYYNATGITSIGIDDTLFIEWLPEEKQTGTNVRRVNGKESQKYTWTKGDFYFVDKPSEKCTPGYTLNSISVMPSCNKYFVDLTPEEKEENKGNDEGAIDFILKSLN